MTKSGFRKDALRAFVNADEGAPPPVFVGRRNVMEDIEGRAGVAWSGPGATEHGSPKATRVIQGAPGAGKSSILAELARRSAERAGESGHPRILILSSQHVEKNMKSVLRAVISLGVAQRAKFMETIRGLSGSVSFSAPAIAGLGVHVGWGDGPSGPEDLSEAAVRFPPERWQAPVIVAIDEAQRFSGSGETDHARFLQYLHDADQRLPLTLVLAGLGDTKATARRMGLTRVDMNARPLGALDFDPGRGIDEPLDLMLGVCRHFGIESDGHEELLKRFAAPSEGWPRHLHIALQALGSEVLAADGDLSRVDWVRAGSRAAEGRVFYYRAQRSPEMEASAGLVAAVMRELRGGEKITDIIDLIERHAGAAGMGSAWRLPDGTSSTGFADHLVHQGALQRNPSVDGFHSPIPSFRTFLIEAGGIKSAPGSDKAD